MEQVHNRDYKKMLDIWCEKTQFDSSIHVMKNYPEYPTLVSEGKKNLYSVYYKMAYESDGVIQSIILARDILNYDPVPKEYAGRVPVMRDVWIAILREMLGFNK